MNKSLLTAKEKLIVWTLLDTGIRLTEFCSIKYNDLDLINHRLAIPHGKGDKKRIVPITARVAMAMEHWFFEKQEIGIARRTVDDIISKIAKRARVNRRVSAHILRHTFAVQSLQGNVSLAGLQKVLGHEDLSTTAIYLNLSNEEACREFDEKREKKRREEI